MTDWQSKIKQLEEQILKLEDIKVRIDANGSTNTKAKSQC